MSEKSANKILERIAELPQFSQIADRAMMASRERSLQSESLEDNGFHDPKLAKQILQMTNYTSFGFSGLRAGFFEAETFGTADVLRGVMLAFSLQDFIKRELPGYSMGECELWEHSMNCALAAWMIATKVGYQDPEAAFVAGLMHDVGKVILDEFVAEEKENCVDIIGQEDASSVHLEREFFGISHAEVGALIGGSWDFDKRIVEAIRCHHEPELAEVEPDLATILHLADCVSISLNTALTGGGLVGLLSSDFSDPVAGGNGSMVPGDRF